MALPSYNSDGKISLTNGSAFVTGIGTYFLAAITPGDIVWTPTGDCRIASIESNTALTLAYGWTGDSQVEGDYEIRLIGDVPRTQETTRQMLALLLAGKYAAPDATGTLAERDAYDDAAQGFIYWQTDVTPFLIFVKQSATSADWSGGTSVQGADGGSGIAGQDGLGDKYDVVFRDPGQAGSGEEVFKAIFAANVSFVENLVGSKVVATTTATDEAIWTLKKNGVSFGTMTFGAGEATPVFSTSASLFEPGDVLTLIAPISQDATLHDVYGVLSGAR